MFNKTFDMHEQSDANGLVQISIPVGEPSTRYHVIVQVTAEATPIAEKDANGWPIGFFEQTAGKWIGELERAPQGEFEERESF